jgi:NitT/TauT family transport system permease protein
MTRRPINLSSGVSRLGGFAVGMSSFISDLPIMLAALALFYALLATTRYWLSPVTGHTEISLQASALPKYAMYSVLRIALAYLVSLIFSVAYGYIAAYHPKAERIMIPLLDTLQSIPVLSFLPGVMVAMIALAPTRQLGIELGSILLIFTGQVWNMAFSFYSSLKTIPREMLEVAKVYRWSLWQRFTELELPYAAVGLIWNSMMSVAGGWFFLMACEMFVLGNRDLRLPGLGSYLQTAANAGDTRAIVWGLATMIGVIALMDQVIWRPVIAWAEKFKFEQVEAAEAPQSPILELLRKSKFLPLFASNITRPLRERVDLHFARRSEETRPTDSRSNVRKWIGRLLLAISTGRPGLSTHSHDRAAYVTDGRRTPPHLLGHGRYLLARGADTCVGRALDDPRRRDDRFASEAFGGCAADCAGCRLRPRDCLVSHHHAGTDQGARRVGRRLDCAASSGNTVVHPF